MSHDKLTVCGEISLPRYNPDGDSILQSCYSALQFVGFASTASLALWYQEQVLNRGQMQRVMVKEVLELQTSKVVQEGHIVGGGGGLADAEVVKSLAVAIQLTATDVATMASSNSFLRLFSACTNLAELIVWMCFCNPVVPKEPGCLILPWEINFM
ncbi:hypothetical protein NDU88_012587 [Pleurodeles waltl]|uniref:Uncharacterized protein n=1 Tax=Pleurodeles waltl TaxID=8319 RepID=A0AAV7R226_PLEWA|nr:hypothetical protein NDU88_012587 [Pleurodeles waltl]